MEVWLRALRRSQAGGVTTWICMDGMLKGGISTGNVYVVSWGMRPRELAWVSRMLYNQQDFDLKRRERKRRFVPRTRWVCSSAIFDSLPSLIRTSWLRKEKEKNLIIFLYLRVVALLCYKTVPLHWFLFWFILTWSYITSRKGLQKTPFASLQKGMISLPNEYSGYDTKQSHGEALVMLKLWGMPSTPSLPSLQGVVTPEWFLFMGQVDLKFVITLNWIVWN